VVAHEQQHAVARLQAGLAQPLRQAGAARGPARLGNGCTSGHGICGLGSLQWPSLLAVLTFMATAFLTANLAARWLA
jgi:hypothetical protein